MREKKWKAWLLGILVVGLKFCKKSDIPIAILVNENIQKSNKSTVEKKWRCHHPNRVYAHIGTANVYFQDKNCVTNAITALLYNKSYTPLW